MQWKVKMDWKYASDETECPKARAVMFCETQELLGGIQTLFDQELIGLVRRAVRKQNSLMHLLLSVEKMPPSIPSAKR